MDKNEQLRQLARGFLPLDSYLTVEMIASIMRIKAAEVICPGKPNCSFPELYEAVLRYEREKGETLEVAMAKQALLMTGWLDQGTRE